MSEENTEVTQPETTETTQPSMDLDSTIKVDGEEISVRELINSRDEAVKLKEYNENARKLISPNGVNDDNREQAVRYLMSQEGYAPEDINEYIEWTKQIEQPTAEPAPESTYDPELTLENDYPEEPQFNEAQYQQEMMMREQEQMRMAEIENRQQKLGTEMMRKEMTSALESAFTQSEEIKKLMGVNEEGNNRKDILRGEVETIMMENLRKRRASGENYNPNWFAEEAGNATKLVYDKFRSVIGDPDKIQRSPETATDSDNLFNKPPVDPPKYEKGDDMGSINTKTREWTLDTLLRGAREDGDGGESKA